MRRTQIYLTDEEAHALKRASKETGLSMSDLVRTAVDEKFLLGQMTTAEKIRAVEESFGAWTGRTETGEQYVERMRSGRLARLHGLDQP
ncbi:MAG: ribbon-helix-helix protein, CopG family [Chloroflexota bacterium]|nr:ribbon-helix-helix protein, CopG family [Chloroflexota bacterium]